MYVTISFMVTNLAMSACSSLSFLHDSYFLFAYLFQRILQNSFTDGVANPCDAASIKSYIVKNEGASSGYPGSTYLLSQKFEFNWMVLGNMDKVK